MGRSIWNPELRAKLVALAARRLTTEQIAAEIGTTPDSIRCYAGREKIVLLVDAEARQERERERLRAREKKRTEQRNAARAREAAKTPMSKTSADYRNRFLPVQNLTKRELQAMLAEAVQNTARLTA